MEHLGSDFSSETYDNQKFFCCRRAHLRDCLETLKEIVPTPPDHQKATTLSLLQNAKHYIKVRKQS